MRPAPWRRRRSAAGPASCRAGAGRSSARSAPCPGPPTCQGAPAVAAESSCSATIRTGEPEREPSAAARRDGPDGRRDVQAARGAPSGGVYRRCAPARSRRSLPGPAPAQAARRHGDVHRCGEPPCVSAYGVSCRAHVRRHANGTRVSRALRPHPAADSPHPGPRRRGRLWVPRSPPSTEATRRVEQLFAS